ncbi:hypothetical protein E6R18_13820 [Streptomyces sp. A1277]|uniref:hypothetical protein n=1 Tax=Streptomyces sp. A1277 TaxID=2563103 RepID=UPI0010A252D3|nr:hypothetical protein [Streptomyces sp. A1277]THA32291.1 hypothetical protein E6R18_13820 [Streptomyces sp. A1277]
MNCGPPKRNATALHERAANGSLPAHQTMDLDTLDWIAENRPPFTSAPPRLSPRAVMLTPDASWFTDPQQAGSLHGIGHNARVSLLASVLANEHGLDRDHALALCAAAAVHDCRRRGDRNDPGHGQRAAQWFTAHTGTVTAALDHLVPPAALARAALAISLHDVPYEAFTPEQNDAYRQAPHLVDLLKAADAMDRYRLPLTRWWPDPTRLRIAVPPWLHPLAFDLLVRSERARLEGATPHQALDHARQTLTRGQ